MLLIRISYMVLISLLMFQFLSWVDFSNTKLYAVHHCWCGYCRSHDPTSKSVHRVCLKELTGNAALDPRCCSIGSLIWWIVPNLPYKQLSLVHDYLIPTLCLSEVNNLFYLPFSVTVVLQNIPVHMYRDGSHCLSMSNTMHENKYNSHEMGLNWPKATSWTWFECSYHNCRLSEIKYPFTSQFTGEGKGNCIMRNWKVIFSVAFLTSTWWVHVI